MPAMFMDDAAGGFRCFADFYPFYLAEHRNRTSRRLHVIGTGLAMLVVGAALCRRRPFVLPVAALPGYGLAWLGHALFERNRPATFSHPFWSLRGDLRLFAETVTGRRPF